jgi:putative peptidoglycan lipid II flippase
LDKEQTTETEPHLRRTTDKPVEPDVSLLGGEQPLDTALLDNESANAMQQGSTGKSVAKATGAIVPMHAVRLLLGIFAQPLIAASTGLTVAAESYTVASDVIQRIWLVFEKVLNPAFLPCFIASMKEDGEERAWKLASTVLWVTTFALIGATVLFWFLMPAIVDIYTPLEVNASQAKIASRLVQINLTIGLARLLLSGLLFLGVSSLTYTILNGYKRFAMAALGDTFWKMGILGGAVWVMSKHGAVQPTDAVHIISYGYIIGAFGKLAPQLLAIGGKWKHLKFRVDFSDPLIRKVALLAVPLLLGIFVSEARGIYISRLTGMQAVQMASGVEASRAALKWSRTIGDALIQIFPYALSIGIFPYLAELAREKDRQPLTDALMGALRVCIFTFAPITAMLIALGSPLLRGVWESGRMGSDDVRSMLPPFIAFSLGMIGFSCEMILNQTFYAMTKAWTPTIMGLVSTVVWIAMATMGVNWGWGLVAIAGAEAASKSLKCVLMWIWMRPHLGRVNPGKFAVFCAKVLVASLIAAYIAGQIGTRLSEKVIADALRPSKTEASVFFDPDRIPFVRDDLQSTSDMLLKLREHKTPLSQYVLEHTSPAFQQKLQATGESHDFDESMKEALITELNRVIEGPLLYDEKRFADESLKVATVDEARKNPTGDERTKLNRQMLEEAYSHELIKRPGKLKILLAVCAAGMMGMFIFIVLGAVLKIEEVSQLGTLGRKIRAKLGR